MAETIDPLAVMDAELARAEASAVSTASAAAHSLRDAAGKAKQQQTADAARARADSMRDARAAVAELIERERKASEMLAIALEAVEIADGVMGYCQGDAWEREATADSRDEFQRKYEILFPPEPLVSAAKKPRPDWHACEQCGGRYRGAQGLRDHWRDKHAALARVGAA